LRSVLLFFGRENRAEAASGLHPIKSSSYDYYVVLQHRLLRLHVLHDRRMSHKQPQNRKPSPVRADGISK